MTEQQYQLVMRLGTQMGCHQLPERSFFIKGHQFPVCARCTGVILGQIIGFCCYFTFELPSMRICMFCGVMLLDWLVQLVRLRESTNLRRLLTGLLCGFALGQFYLGILVRFIEKIF